jgi:hypothetical protein
VSVSPGAAFRVLLHHSGQVAARVVRHHDAQPTAVAVHEAVQALGEVRVVQLRAQRHLAAAAARGRSSFSSRRHGRSRVSVSLAWALCWDQGPLADMRRR